MQVLIVDDSVTSLMVLERTLVEAGHTVCTARNGREALAILRQGPCRLVISDWEMPCMTGIELSRAIRSRTPPRLCLRDPVDRLSFGGSGRGIDRGSR